MIITDLLNILYPGQLALDNIRLGQEGDNKPFITYWNVPNIAQPTMEQIEANYTDAGVLQKYTFMQNIISNTALIEQLNALDLKAIRPLLEQDVVRIADLNAQKAALRAQLLPVQ